MVSEEKLEKIMRMMEASGIVGNFEGMLRTSMKNISAHLKEMERLFGEEDLVGLDGASAYLVKQIERIKAESKELYLKELISKKKEVLHAFALIYDENLDEARIDAFYELYSTDTWKEILKFQPVLLQKQFEIISKYDMAVSMIVFEFVRSKELEIRAKCLAKRAFGREIESGESFDKALKVFGKKYRKVLAQG